MSATDELRRMLNEAGVEWDYGITGAASTRFNANGVELTFIDMRDGVTCSTILTPAQAIAATVGASGRESYDAGFASGVKAALQQLYGLLHEYPTLDEIEAWADSQWEVDE